MQGCRQPVMRTRHELDDSTLDTRRLNMNEVFHAGRGHSNGAGPAFKAKATVTFFKATLLNDAQMKSGMGVGRELRGRVEGEGFELHSPEAYRNLRVSAGEVALSFPIGGFLHLVAIDIRPIDRYNNRNTITRSKE